MAEIQELILDRVQILTDELTNTEETIHSRIAIHPLDIQYVEDYIGTLLKNEDNDLTNVFLYGDIAILVKKDLMTLLKEINKKRAAIRRDGFFKKSN